MTVRTFVHPDNEKGFVIERWQDCEAIIDDNKRLQAEAQRSDFLRHKARIPNIIIEKWLNEERARGNTSIMLFDEEFDRLIARKLDDPDWKWLRTDGASSGVLGFGG